MKRITKNTVLADILNNKKFVKILNKYKMPCLSCPFAQFEIQHLTLEEVCKAYQINLKKLLQELNKQK